MNVLVTGANRGIGLEFVKQFLSAGFQVFATSRNLEDSSELMSLHEESTQLKCFQCDVSNESSITQLAGKVSEPVDILINNAGFYGGSSQYLEQLDCETWLQTLRINTFAPVLMAKHFRSLLASSDMRSLVNISSKMGSIHDNSSGACYYYRTSKAALNAASKSLALDLASQGIKVVTLHPGWVKTQMGGPNALITTKESVENMMKIIMNLKPDQSGHFFDYKGTEIKW